MRMRENVQLAAALCLAFMAPACAPAENVDARVAEQHACPSVVELIDADLAAKIDPIVDSALDRGFAGGVAVMRDGVLVYKRVAGSASLEEDIPVSEETLFHVASISKYLTAALVMKAAEEGVLSLGDSVAKFAPESQTGQRGVTIFDLLAHRSGLGSSYAAESETDRDGAFAAIDNAGFEEERVGTFRYSNDGYDLLGVLLERAYDRPYEEIINEKIFAPLCLERPRIWGSVDVADPQLVSQPLSTVSAELRQRNYGLIGSGGLLITAIDLALYQRALSSGAILNDASVTELFAPRGEMRIGQATFGAFLSDHDALGRKLNARGYEDWGDNAIMNHYLDRNIIVAVVTSRGPAEDSGEPPFRNELSEAIEEIFAGADRAAE